MRGITSGASNIIAIAALDIRGAFQRHFDYFYDAKPWHFRGLYLMLPFQVSLSLAEGGR